MVGNCISDLIKSQINKSISLATSQPYNSQFGGDSMQIPLTGRYVVLGDVARPQDQLSNRTVQTLISMCKIQIKQCIGLLNRIFTSAFGARLKYTHMPT